LPLVASSSGTRVVRKCQKKFQGRSGKSPFRNGIY